MCSGLRRTLVVNADVYHPVIDLSRECSDGHSEAVSSESETSGFHCIVSASTTGKRNNVKRCSTDWTNILCILLLIWSIILTVVVNG